MAEKLTDQQYKAVTDRGGKLLVSAAAGSGKTKVLVERLLGYLTDKDDPADLDEFLIITYTKAAASELRGKIGSRLSELIAEHPENRHMQQQIQRLYMTKISTVHAFCADILREYAYRLDIAADFRVADENECKEMQMRVLDQLLANTYSTINENADFKALIDTQGFGRDDRMIPQIILKVYNSAKCHLDPDAWLEQCIRAADISEISDASQTIWGKYLIDDLHHYIELNIAALQRCIDLAVKVNGMEKPVALLNSTVVQLSNLLKAGTWEEIVERKTIDYGRLVFSKKCEDPILAERIKAIRSNCKKGLEKKLRNFGDSSAQVLGDLKASCPSIRGLIELVRQFEIEYTKLKKHRRVMDFADLEHKTLDLLMGKKRTAVTLVAREIGARFREIMVDEYQDSNEVQDAIFTALSDAKQNCFMVGDVKQSIYQFRLADPTIFIDKYNRYLPAGNAEDGKGRKILLSNNFRSGGEIISAVNAVFSATMSERVGGLPYGDEEMLREGIQHVPLNEPAVELHCIQVQEDTYAEEAAFVAGRVKELLDGNHCVRDGDVLRPIKPEDIVILLRSPGSVGGEFCYALEANGIRYTIGATGNVLQTEEVSALVALLQVISNPQQDIPLAAVLMSRIFCFTADQMAQIRGQDRKSSLYDLLKGSDLAVDFVKILNELRLDARLLRIPQLLERIFTLTRWDSIFSSMPDGKDRMANLQMFSKLASEFDASGRGDLDQFLNHLAAIQESGLNNIVDGQQSGCVTIMSIHKSKGLEFPVVFLCGLSRSFNLESVREPVLCDKDLGLGLSCVDTVQRVRYPSVSKRAIAVKTISDSISEEMRVLYVAMTRAKDRLIMTYAIKNLKADLEDIALRIDLSGQELMTCQVDCMGSWVLQTAMMRTEAGELLALGGHPDNVRYAEPLWLIKTSVVDACIDSDSEDELNPTASRVDADMEFKLGADLAFSYAHEAATHTPSKQTATQLKGRVKDHEAAENTVPHPFPARKFRKPSFLVAQRDSTEYGAAMHSVMQYIHYDACCDVAGVKREVQRLIKQRLISEEQAAIVSCDQIAAFFSSDIGKKVRNSSEVLREFKFSILDDANNYGPGMEDENILLQGVVDCALIETDGITIIDFKTDNVSELTLSQVSEQYHAQVLSYANALQRIYCRPIKAALLYFFRMDRFVSVL